MAQRQSKEKKEPGFAGRLLLLCLAAILCLLIYAISEHTPQGESASEASEKHAYPTEMEFLNTLMQDTALRSLGGGRYALSRGEGLSDAELVLLVNNKGVYGFSLLAERPNLPGTISPSPNPAEEKLTKVRQEVWNRNLDWLEESLKQLSKALFPLGDGPDPEDLELFAYYAELSMEGEKLQKAEEQGCAFQAYMSKGYLHLQVERNSSEEK